MELLRFEPEVFYYTYASHPPALRVTQTQTVETWTADSSNGAPDGATLPRDRRQHGDGLLEYNPVTGPFFLEGAEPGDAVAVHFETIELNQATAFGAVHPHLDVLGDDVAFIGPTGLKPPVEGRRYDWELDLERQVARLTLPHSEIGAVEIPVHPFLGCVGVAPRWGEALNTVDAGRHGGNLDCPEIRSGATVLLPVNVPGALLMFGDAHAAQGDGEIAGGALETTARVRFRYEVLKGRTLRWPRIETPTAIFSLASGRPLLDVLRIAWVEMILWLEGEYGFDRWDALHLVSQVGKARPCNVVSPSYTAIVEFPRELLPGVKESDRGAGSRRVRNG